MTDLLIVRHAQSTWNAQGRWQGWADPPLSALGERQATQAGRALGEELLPDIIVSSDLQRARRTAQLISAAVAPDVPLPGAAVQEDAALREYDVGEWTGLRRDEIALRWPGVLEEWDAGRLERAPGGEDQPAFAARLLGAVGRIHDTNPEARVLAVSHGRALHALGRSLGVPAGHFGHLTGWRLRTGDGPRIVGTVALLPATTGAPPESNP